MTHDEFCQDFDGGHVCICDVLEKVRADEKEQAVRRLINLSCNAWGSELSPTDFKAVFAAVRGDKRA